MNSQKKSSIKNMFSHKLSSICKLPAQRKILELLAKCLMLAFLWSFICPLPAIAVEYNVTTTADTINGAGLSLREAIIDANSNSGQDTINLPAGTASGQKFRLKGKGVPGSGKKVVGDLYAVIQVRPPKKLDKRSRELLDEFRERNE